MSTVDIQCPECGVVISLPIETRVEDDNVVVDCDPADVWAHAWTHETPTTATE